MHIICQIFKNKFLLLECKKNTLLSSDYLYRLIHSATTLQIRFKSFFMNVQ